MQPLAKGSRVIVDTSFIRSSPPDGSKVRSLADAGYLLVLIDNMAFELCSTSNQAQWPATQMKLMTCVDAVDCWHHTGPMLCVESDQGRSYGDPFFKESTRLFRDVLRGRRPYVPDNLEAVTRKEQDIREKLALPAMFATFARCAANLTRFEPFVQGKPLDQVFDACYRLVNNEENIRRFLDVADGQPPFPLDRLDETWVAWHHAKAFLAILCDYIRQGKPSFQALGREARKRWVNRKHDLDYLVSLAFADTLATNETAGEMAHYCRWMYGDTKPCISLADV